MLAPRFKEKLVDWKSLYDNLTPQLADMPQLTADYTALGTVLGQTQDLETKQDAVRGMLRDVNQQRQELASQGTTARNRLAAALRLALGTDSAKLVTFGLKPRVPSAPRKRLPETEKAARAAARALAKAAAVKAAEKTTPLPVNPPAS